VRRLFGFAILLAVLPGSAADWERAKPESVGFSTAKLEALRGWLQHQRTTSMLIVSRGRVVFEYGDTKLVSKVASVRKSVLAMLFGVPAVHDKLDIGKTVVQLGLDDVQPFLAVEKNATLMHLLTARSGIYHASGNDDLTSRSPRRGAQIPGLYFQYQNWDFNAAGTAFERISGKDIFEALETYLAKPLDMQDFVRGRQLKVDNKPQSVHPEYAMYLSTRDMARLGELMLRKGLWNGNRILNENWATSTTTLVTRPADIHPIELSLPTRANGRWGYGMLWWVWDAPVHTGMITGPFQGAFAAMGANGQYIVVLPVADTVVVHKVDFDSDGSRQVSPEEFQTILQMVVNANCNPCQ